MVAVATVPVLALGASPAWSASPGPVPVPDDLLAQGYEVPEPLGVSEGLKAASGTVEVTVRLAEPAIAEVVPEGSLAQGKAPGKAAQKDKKNKVAAQQAGFEKSAKGLGAKVLGKTQLSANLVVLSVDASQLEEIADLPNVVSVRALGKYETHSNEEEVESGSLAQAIDYVQARAVHEAGFDGTGVRVAVLDSGIDFTHKNLGGPGTQAIVDECFAGADAAVTGNCAALFGPDAPKVKGGYDFVGDAWPNSATVFDPNPIDSGPAGGHGTHVADIIAGRSADGTHEGIAPGADLYAVKVCSAVSTACNGVAILQGLDWSLDPNGDGDISDAVDIVNMSLGASYGQDADDSSFAANNLVNAGVVVVVSAGNSADRPFIVGSPSSAPGVISVAQTALPDDLQWVLVSGAGLTIGNAVHMAWSPLPSGASTANLVVPAGTEGCAAGDFTGFPDGAVALIARGTCAISVKAFNAQNAGATAVIITNNVAGDPPSFSFGGPGPITVPTFSVSLADGNALRASLPTTISLDPADAIPLTNTMVGTSSRGVTVTDNRAKPDIGAPGAWLSAETATGDAETGFGGTSGAAPVVAGVAALLLDKFEGATPATIKSRLLNSADNTNRTPTATGFIPTPISRIGAGEVRAAGAANAAGVLSTANVGGNVGLGIPSVTDSWKQQVELTITNTSGSNKKYNLAASFRDSADAATGAVSVKVTPKSITVPKGKTQKVKVMVTVNGSKLESWPFNFAGSIGNGSALNGPEFDGWITATSGSEQLHLGWTVLPRKAADVSAAASVQLDGSGAGAVALENASKVELGTSDVFALTGTSPKQAPSAAGTPGSNTALIDLAATGVRTYDLGDGFDVVEFAIATYDRRTVLTYPAEFDVYIDTNNDGTDDFVMYNAEAGGFAATGQSLVYVVNLATGAGGAYFYNAGGFDSSTQSFLAPLSVLGLEEGDTFSFSVYAFDNYFTGALTDAIEGQSFTIGESVYAADAYVEVPANGSASLAVSATGAEGGSSQTGFLLLHQSAAENDYSVVEVTP
jgi:subtilisin family serine protease